MSDFAPAIDLVLENEGSAFTPDDAGAGPQKYGILLSTYRELYPKATVEDIQNLGPEQAKAFYRTEFWQKYHIGLINDQTLGNKVLDLVVNVGPVAIKWLQGAVGVSQDMILGLQTGAAVNALPPAQVLSWMREIGAGYYRTIAAENPAKYGKYLDGWLARLAK